MKTKQDLVDRLIEQIKNDIAQSDVTVLDEILMNCNTNVLVNSLPEEEWNDFKELTATNDVDVAKETLKDKGFYVENLWSVYDVKDKFKCSDDEALEVIHRAMKNDATMEQIWFAIKLEAENKGFEEINSED